MKVQEGTLPRRNQVREGKQGKEGCCGESAGVSSEGNVGFVKRGKQGRNWFGGCDEKYGFFGLEGGR